MTWARTAIAAAVVAVLCGCGQASEGGAGLPGPGPGPGSVDGSVADGPESGAADDDAGTASHDGGAASDGGALGDGGSGDGGPGADGGPADAGVAIDAAPVGTISGGPCLSGASGQTGYRVRFAGNGSGSTAYPVYEINGLPDTSRDKTGAYGYQIGFSPSFVDPFLGEGGLQLNSSSFVDIELSTAGIGQIHTATLSIYGRSYNTTASGSFNWQTFVDVGSSPSGLVHNSAPYQWYSADMTTALDPGNSGVLLRIKAGPPSGSLVVNRIELCLDAD